MEKALFLAKKLIPKRVFSFFQPAYHYSLALLGAMIYRLPARHIKVVFVTGTKGKSSTVEILNTILEKAGYKTAVAGTVRFKVREKSWPNLYKMTIPGRFFLQKFLRESVTAKCDYAIIEMTSEGAKQFRHKFIPFDALIFTNLAPEHIESHGSYEKYLLAKLSLCRALENSNKKNRVVVANTDDKEGFKFLETKVETAIPYSLKNAEPYKATSNGLEMTIDGEVFRSLLKGIFNIYNILGAVSYAKSQGIKSEDIKEALENLSLIRGRAEIVRLPEKNLGFDVVVDYAHTPDSLRAIYEAFKDKKIIGVLGNTGGGRDKWKRPEMGKIADIYCEKIILTNEDPYNEDPEVIVKEIAEGIKNHKPEIIMDRREAIGRALRLAEDLVPRLTPRNPSTSSGQESSGLARDSYENDKNVVVLITGKGTDPYIMESNGKKTPWDDASVVRQELEKLSQNK